MNARVFKSPKGSGNIASSTSTMLNTLVGSLFVHQVAAQYSPIIHFLCQLKKFAIDQTLYIHYLFGLGSQDLFQNQTF